MKNNIKKYRTLKKITQEESAKYAGISLSYFQKVESGLSVPNVYIALKLSKLYNVSVEDIFPIK